MKKAVIICMAVVLFAVSFLIGKTGTEPEKKVLLALEDTRFKKALVDEMKRILESSKIDVKVINHSDNALDHENPSAYNAVFITNSGVNSRLRPWIIDWLGTHEGSVSNVLIHTTYNKKTEYGLSVDAVTSASKLKDVKKLAQDYCSRIIRLTNSEKKDSETE